MPAHDWTKVSQGIFHDFNNSWVVGVKNMLSSGVLPSDYYAVTEQVAGAENPSYASLRKTVVIRHGADHEVVALIEILSRGNKASRAELERFLTKAQSALQQGIHLLVHLEASYVEAFRSVPAYWRDRV
jgi:hypothetical protein